MYDPRHDLLMSLKDFHVARIGGREYRCVFAESAADAEDVSTATPLLAMAGTRYDADTAEVYEDENTKARLSIGDEIASITAHNALFERYAVAEIFQTEGPMIRFRLRKL